MGTAGPWDTEFGTIYFNKLSKKRRQMLQERQSRQQTKPEVSYPDSESGLCLNSVMSMCCSWEELIEGGGGGGY